MNNILKYIKSYAGPTAIYYRLHMGENFNNASRDINLLLFVKMYCKTLIKKMEKQSATH